MRDDILDDELYIPKANTAENAREILRLKFAYSEMHKKIVNGRKALWWLVGLQTIGMIIECVRFEFDLFVVVANVVIVGIFFIAAIVAIKKPFIGFMTGLVFLLLFIVILIVDSPQLFLRILLWKGIIAYFIITAMANIKDYKETLKALKAYGINLKGTELV